MFREFELKAPGEAQTQTARSKLYSDAADYLEQHGHCKRVLQTPDGAVCLRGALRVIMYGAITVRANCPEENEILDEMCNELYRLGAVTQLSFSQPMAWNNAPDRTQKEVVDFLRHMSKQT